jgi:hypothetical protein
VRGDFATTLAWVQALAGPVIAQGAPSITWGPFTRGIADVRDAY